MKVDETGATCAPRISSIRVLGHQDIGRWSRDRCLTKGGRRMPSVQGSASERSTCSVKSRNSAWTTFGQYLDNIHLDNIWTTFGQHYSIWTLDSAGTNLQSWFSLGLRRYFRRQQGGRRHLNSDIMGPPRRLNKTIKRITICLSQTPCIQLL